MSGVVSKLQMLASTLEVKDYAPSLASIAACIAISKIYQIDLPKPLIHSPHKKCSTASMCCQFMKQLIPGPVSQEALYLYGLLGSLIAEVYVHYYTITTCTKMEAFIVEKDSVQFGMNLVKFLLNVPLLSFVSSIKQFLTDELKIRFGERLSNQLHSQFTMDTNLCHDDSSFENAGEVLSRGGQRVGRGVVDLFAEIAKALIQLVFYFRVLSKMHGTAVPKKFLIFMIIVHAIMAAVRKPLRKLRHESHTLEKKSDRNCQNLVANAEAIAASNGRDQETFKQRGMMNTVSAHMRRITAATLTSTFTDNILTKYLVLIAGWATSSRPFFDSENEALAELSEVETMPLYYNTARFMLAMYNSISMLKHAKCQAESLHRNVEGIEQMMDKMNQAAKHRKNLNGTVNYENDTIRLNEVTFECTEHENLVENCTIEIRRGQNVFVSSTEGARAFMKTVAGVMPHKKGQLTRPAKGKVLYITRSPYVFESSLRDVLIYPHRPIDMMGNGVNDAKLEQILEKVQLSHFVGRLEEVNDWTAAMNNSEKEKLAVNFQSSVIFCFFFPFS
ncbi:hypothetical protein WR25_27067 isoform B [Diploscapter pachys]|uniref:ABC transmembrane type-1 domain-containing protein n=1 Tax=Diploscapter pachys TaxID=2018661 RepID=A0A2A2KCK3_9BILA|nr:hypothetical protein WR25_27067 isoform B [Diploscapter pachys]